MGVVLLILTVLAGLSFIVTGTQVLTADCAAVSFGHSGGARIGVFNITCLDEADATSSDLPSWLGGWGSVLLGLLLITSFFWLPRLLWLFGSERREIRKLVQTTASTEADVPKVDEPSGGGTEVAVPNGERRARERRSSVRLAWGFVIALSLVALVGGVTLWQRSGESGSDARLAAIGACLADPTDTPPIVMSEAKNFIAAGGGSSLEPRNYTALIADFTIAAQFGAEAAQADSKWRPLSDAIYQMAGSLKTLEAVLLRSPSRSMSELASESDVQLAREAADHFSAAAGIYEAECTALFRSSD